MAGVMREFVGLFVFFSLSFIFSCCFCAISKIDDTEKNMIAPIVLKKIQFSNFSNIKFLTIFSIYAIQLILLFVIAIVYNAHRAFLFVEVVIFLMFILLGLVFLYKKTFWKADEANR